MNYKYQLNYLFQGRCYVRYYNNLFSLAKFLDINAITQYVIIDMDSLEDVYL